jgi:hypothetical protein
MTTSSPLPISSDFSLLPDAKTVANVSQATSKVNLSATSGNIRRGFCVRVGKYAVLLYLTFGIDENKAIRVTYSRCSSGYIQGNDEDDCLQLMLESLTTVIFCTKRGLSKREPKEVVLVINSSSTISDSISYQVEDLESCTFTKCISPLKNSFG